MILLGNTNRKISLVKTESPNILVILAASFSMLTYGSAETNSTL